MHNIYYLGLSGEHRCPLGYLFKYLTGNKFALIDISMIRMCNKIKIKAS